MNTIADRLAGAYPDANKGYGVIVEPFSGAVGLDTEASLYLLFAAVGILLVIACVNLANLAIVRAAARARDVAIRAALGATRAQIVRQFLVEQLVIAPPRHSRAWPWRGRRRIAVLGRFHDRLLAAYPAAHRDRDRPVVWLFARRVRDQRDRLRLSPAPECSAVRCGRLPATDTLRASAAWAAVHARQILVVAEVRSRCAFDWRVTADPELLHAGADGLIAPACSRRRCRCSASRVPDGRTVNRHLTRSANASGALPAFATSRSPTPFRHRGFRTES
jgi:hypothetical protein